MSGSIEFLCGGIETNVGTLSGTIAKKYTTLRLRNKFVVIIRCKPWVVEATKDSKFVIVGSLIEEYFSRGFYLETRCG